MAQRITKRLVDQLQPGEKDVIVWDGVVKGFGVRCRTSGNKFYVLKTRVHGDDRWFTIGRHGSPWTPEQARAEALRLLGEKARGIDPAAERNVGRRVSDIQELADRFVAEHVSVNLKEKTQRDYRHLVDNVLVPRIGRLKVKDISRADVSDLVYILRDTPYLANRALAVLSKMMNKAEEWNLRPTNSNPCRHVKRFKEKKRERYLTTEEFRRLGDVLADAERNGTESVFATSLVRLLILTGARVSEIQSLRWEFVDISSGVLRLPDSKSGKKTIFLNDAAIEVLENIPRLDGNPYVIVGRAAQGHLVNLKSAWGRMREKAGLSDVRIHDLRHSFASIAAGQGLSLPLIGALLGHTQPATTARYAHLADDPMLQAAKLIGAEIADKLAVPEKRRRVRLEHGDYAAWKSRH